MPCWFWMMLTNDDRKYGEIPADIANGEWAACWLEKKRSAHPVHPELNVSQAVRALFRGGGGARN